MIYKILGIISFAVLSFIRAEENIERPIVIVIPSYNNRGWYERNLNSVFSQEYNNYRVIYIDDYSSDGMGECIEQYIERNHLQDKITFIRNTQRRGALENLYNAIHSCDDYEVVVTLDGDDWLPDPHVLSYLNSIYASGNVWLTYGQFVEYPQNVVGWCSAHSQETVSLNKFRDHGSNASHLRTFYAVLFKNILKEDLMYEGKFYSMTWDQAIMYPMLEMAGERHRFVNRVMLVYNTANILNDHKVNEALQRYLATVIRKNPKYKRLKSLEKRGCEEKVYQEQESFNSIIRSPDSAHAIPNKEELRRKEEARKARNSYKKQGRRQKKY